MKIIQEYSHLFYMLQRIALSLDVCRMPYGAIISNDARYSLHLNLCPLEDSKGSRKN